MIRREKSIIAFVRLQRTTEGKALAQRWGNFHDDHQRQESYKRRAQANPEFMRAYDAARDAVTVPSKRKAIREFLDVWETKKP